MRVVPVPVLEDNFAYLLIDELSKQAAAVDPVEPAKVIEAAAREGVIICSVLTTHSHWDHSGGNEEFSKLVPDAVIYGGKHDTYKPFTRLLDDGDTVRVGGIVAKALHTPFHTPGHVCFHCTEVAGGSGAAGGAAAAAAPDAAAAPGVVFTGDALFVAGCGRINGRGTPAQFKRSLVDVIGALPRDTLVYVGHEYTAANLRFATAVEPGNTALAALAEQAKAALAAGKPTVPSTVGTELAANPFLRPASAEVRAFVSARLGEEALASDETVLAGLRSIKDSFGLGSSAGI
ncbi:hypothetical protein FNF31_00442 [Cafeteria roenbergensis]|uniref:Metallo-beta-lactamase domain-containing protein n=1 Tax=Cafeteria roenbergensis TaxID=33653 RepID=A0A5A8DSZ6_CAFRO|nr:hypothetical protein FNF31_00442 [Cafeteria roenbergensis]KAA0171155.1 hypothetical protein FNF28_00922 [Cafeteria roenbergensis]